LLPSLCFFALWEMEKVISMGGFELQVYLYLVISIYFSLFLYLVLVIKVFFSGKLGVEVFSGLNGKWESWWTVVFKIELNYLLIYLFIKISSLKESIAFWSFGWFFYKKKIRKHCIGHRSFGSIVNFFLLVRFLNSTRFYFDLEFGCNFFLYVLTCKIITWSHIIYL